jgi:hypothetical protein
VKNEAPGLLIGVKRDLFVGGGGGDGEGSGSMDLRMKEEGNVVTAGAAPRGGACGDGVAKVTPSVANLEGGPGGPRPTVRFQKTPSFNTVGCTVATRPVFTFLSPTLMVHCSSAIGPVMVSSVSWNLPSSSSSSSSSSTGSSLNVHYSIPLCLQFETNSIITNLGSSGLITRLTERVLIFSLE